MRFKTHLHKHIQKELNAELIGDETYKCDQWDYESIQKGMLVIHQRVKHNGDVFKCDECGLESGYPNSKMRRMKRVYQI